MINENIKKIIIDYIYKYEHYKKFKKSIKIIKKIKNICNNFKAVLLSTQYIKLYFINILDETFKLYY